MPESTFGLTTELSQHLRDTLAELARFPLLDALYGRRSRRFPLGGEISDGLLAYTSRHAPLPLSELERLIVLTSMAGTTAGIMRSSPRPLRAVSGQLRRRGRRGGRSVGGRVPHRELFFTDDSGTYFFPTRDAGAFVDPRSSSRHSSWYSSVTPTHPAAVDRAHLSAA